jgi:hypothetical protein
MNLTKRLFFVLLSAMTVLACGGGMQAPAMPSPAPSASTVMGEDTLAGHQQVMDALKLGGHDCENSAKAIACDAKKQGAFTFAIVQADNPRRLVIVVPSQLKVPCEEAAPRFNALNHEFETVTLSCENGDFAAAGVVFVPKAGLTATDVNNFVAPWLAQLATIIRANKLDEIVK